MLDYKIEGFEAGKMANIAKLLRLERPLVVLDVETTGQFAGRDRIIQFGGVKIQPDGTSRALQIDINPETDIPAEATRIHGITNKQLEGKPTFKEVGGFLKEYLEGCDISGFNVDFDIKFLGEEFKRAKIEVSRGKIVDVFRIFVLKEPRDLTAAVKFYLDETLVNAHNALVDTRATARVLEAQLVRYDDIGSKNTKEIHALFNTAPEGYIDAKKRLVLRDGKPVMNFSTNHKGKNLEDVPKDFRKWMLRSDFSEEVKEVVRESLKPKSDGEGK